MSPQAAAGDDAGALDRAAALLAEGGLVAFPTETVYGLGADATQPAAVEAIYRLKGRPLDHPVIVHVAPDVDLARWAQRVPAKAVALVERFWPGPLTLILERAPGVPATVSAGQATIGLRAPAHPVARALIAAFIRAQPRHRDAQGRHGIAAPSANRFGRLSPTAAQHVVDEFGPELFVLDGGACAVGIESTILDLSRFDERGAVLLRPGAIGAALLAETLDAMPAPADAHAPRAPGTLAAHYAPRTPLRIVSRAEFADMPPEVLAWTFEPLEGGHTSRSRIAPRDPIAYARVLYATLRELDRENARAIWVERPPDHAAWTAILDRLQRAEAGTNDEET